MYVGVGHPGGLVVGITKRDHDIVRVLGRGAIDKAGRSRYGEEMESLTKSEGRPRISFMNTLGLSYVAFLHHGKFLPPSRKRYFCLDIVRKD